MCLLIYSAPNTTIPTSHLREAAINNPDGFGFAIRTRKGIITHRSMDIDDVIERWDFERARHSRSHAMFHLRITTHGGTNIDNCHPFEVERGVVLGHNGMLPIEEKDGMSDTRQFATEWLPTMGVEVLDDPKEFSDIEHFARGSKMVILSNSDKLSSPVYIVNEKDGHWLDGVWYSNSSYKPWRPIGQRIQYDSPRYSPIYSSGWEPQEEDLSEELSRGYEFDSSTGIWSDGVSDIEGWYCPNCDTTQWYDLTIDNPDSCDICDTCWYCANNRLACSCEWEA